MAQKGSCFVSSGQAVPSRRICAFGTIPGQVVTPPLLAGVGAREFISTRPLFLTGSSSREVGIRVPFFL